MSSLKESYDTGWIDHPTWVTLAGKPLQVRWTYDAKTEWSTFEERREWIPISEEDVRRALDWAANNSILFDTKET